MRQGVAQMPPKLHSSRVAGSSPIGNLYAWTPGDPNAPGAAGSVPTISDRARVAQHSCNAHAADASQLRLRLLLLLLCGVGQWGPNN